MRLKGFDNVGTYTLCDQLEWNLIDYFNWGFLQAGGFWNLNETLTQVSDFNLPGKTIYSPSHKNMVWENDLEQFTPQIPEVRVNGNVVTNYSLDWVNGYVTFNSPPTATPTMRYAARQFTFVDDNQDWYKRIVDDLYRVDGDNNTMEAALSNSAIQLPTVVVGCDPGRKFTGYQLGGGHIIQQDVLFTIFAPNRMGRKKLIDVITFQMDRTVPMYDVNKVVGTADDFLEDGQLNPNRVGYEQLISRPGLYSWDRNMFFKPNPVVKDFGFSPSVYSAQIKFPMEVIVGF